MSDAHAPNPLTGLSAALSGIVERVAPSIVQIHHPGRRPATTGFVWRPGYAVTAEEPLGTHETLTLEASGHQSKATVIGRDPSTDIAVLKLADESLPALMLNTSLALKAGQLVLSVGQTDYGPSARLGIVSVAGGPWRSMRGGRIDSLLRLDLTLDRRSEGAALLDAEGQAFGMAVRGRRRSVLAIPAATIERIAAHIVEKGSVRPGYLGLGLHSVPLPSNEKSEGADRGVRAGLIVLSVAPDGPGHKAGLLQGDVIASWGGEPVNGMRSVLRKLGPDSVGETVQLGLVRAGQSVPAQLTIAPRPVA